MHDARMHMSKEWPQAQFKKLGYKYILYKDLQPRISGLPVAESLCEEAKAAL